MLSSINPDKKTDIREQLKLGSSSVILLCTEKPKVCTLTFNSMRQTDKPNGRRDKPIGRTGKMIQNQDQFSLVRTSHEKTCEAN